MITTVIEQYGYLGIIFLLALENVFPPLPSEIVLIFAGYSTLHTSLSIWGASLAATLGAYIGALILYGLGRSLNVDQLKKFTKTRAGRFIRLKEKDVEKTDAFFRKNGGWTILVGRCIPVIRSLISIPAGMTRYPLGKFSVLTLGGTLIWNLALINVGHYAGREWRQILGVVEEWLHLILLAAVIIGVAVWIYQRRKKKV